MFHIYWIFTYTFCQWIVNDMWFMGVYFRKKKKKQGRINTNWNVHNYIKKRSLKKYFTFSNNSNKCCKILILRVAINISLWREFRGKWIIRGRSIPTETEHVVTFDECSAVFSVTCYPFSSALNSRPSLFMCINWIKSVTITHATCTSWAFLVIQQ